MTETGRVRLAHLPTPLEPLERLSAELGGPRIWVKRDDCTGLAGGGNKTRKLEFLLGDALGQDADTVLTTGAVQSNHARQTAAACAKLGLDCELFLKRRVRGRGLSYDRSGNVLLDRLIGARMTYLSGDTDTEEAMEERAAKLREVGRRPYVIPAGGSNAIGASGYVECAQELCRQATRMGFEIGAVVHASGSRGTQAGLVVGLAEFATTNARVMGIDISGPTPQARANVERVAAATRELLGQGPGIPEIEIDDRFIGEGYGIPSPKGLSAMRLLARLEGILLDPVYTGKAMAGLVAMVREGRFADDEDVIFLHTGGWPALFAYEEELSR